MTDSEHRQTIPPSTATRPNAPTHTVKRAYKPPTLTAYGRVDDLVDAAVVGSATSVPNGTA